MCRLRFSESARKAAPGAVSKEPDFTGRVTQFQRVSSGGTVGLVLVEARIVREGTEYLDKYMVTGKDDTLILEQGGRIDVRRAFRRCPSAERRGHGEPPCGVPVEALALLVLAWTVAGTRSYHRAGREWL